MTKEDLLLFNVGTPYMDCLQSFKRELVTVLTEDGRIQENQLIIKEFFANIKPDDTTLQLNVKNAYDEFYVCLENRMSGILISIPELDVTKISISLKRSETSDDDRAWSKRTLSEIIRHGDIVETLIVWLQDAKLTQWAQECFVLRESQIIAEEY